MSAYIVDKNHIVYLVEAAMNRAIEPHTFRWCVDDQTKPGGYREGELRKVENPVTACEVANMLWRENIASVSYRYPKESSATLPGPIGGRFVIQPSDLMSWPHVDPIQVLKACDCYEYQSCEHPEWKTSEAKAFIDSLRKSAWHSLPGYSKAMWGAPDRDAEAKARAAYYAAIRN